MQRERSRKCRAQADVMGIAGDDVPRLTSAAERVARVCADARVHGQSLELEFVRAFSDVAVVIMSVC
jgi:hypothetical protein